MDSYAIPPVPAPGTRTSELHVCRRCYPVPCTPRRASRPDRSWGNTAHRMTSWDIWGLGPPELGGWPSLRWTLPKERTNVPPRNGEHSGHLGEGSAPVRARRQDTAHTESPDNSERLKRRFEGEDPIRRVGHRRKGWNPNTVMLTAMLANTPTQGRLPRNVTLPPPTCHPKRVRQRSTNDQEAQRFLDNDGETQVRSSEDDRRRYRDACSLGSYYAEYSGHGRPPKHGRSALYLV